MGSRIGNYRELSDMVGIVNGSGLGLNFTSYTGTMGQAGVWGQAGLGQRGTQIYINGYTGNLIVQDRDGLLAGVGTDLQALRTYNSRGSFNDDNGDNWIAGFVRQAMRLTGGTWGAAGSTVTVTNEDGSERLYTWVTNRYVSTTGSGGDTYLTLNGDLTQATFSNGPQSGTFDVATGRLLSWNSPTLLNAVFTYDANGRLAGMASDANGTGGRIVYEYSGNLLQRVSVLNEQAKAVSTTLYAYDANGRLSRVTVDLSPEDGVISDGKVYTTDYTYVVAADATNGMLRSITNSDGTSQTFRWVMSEGTARISQSWGADGKITDYVINLASKAARVTQPGGFTTDFWYDGLGRLKQSHPSKGANNGVTTDATRIYFEYYTTDNQATFADYDRGITAFNYDTDNNVIMVRDPAGNTVRRTYVNRLVVTETVYAVADPDGDGTLGPGAPATTRFIYDAEGKLHFKISPEGVVTELRYTGRLPTSTITYLGGAYNVSGLTATQVPTEAQLNTWVGSADKSRTSRIDTLYDARGEKLRETAYAATDAAGNGLAAGQHVVVYAYDAAGRLLSMTDGSGATVTYTYDGLGRVLTRQQDGILTSYIHQDGSGGYVSTVTEQSGLVTVSTFDAMGRLLGVTQTKSGSELGRTANYYDARGLLYKTQDATGVLHWYLYDERANKVAEVDGNGTVTEFRYDVAQRPVQTIVYAAPLAALTGASPNLAWAEPPSTPLLATIRPTETPGKDIKRWTVYNISGRPIKTVDGAGFVTETRYDAAGRVTGTVRYANAIDLAVFAASPVTANASPTLDPINDRVTRSFYSTEGRLLGELDAEGYLVENRYDAAGRLSARVRYAEPTPSNQREAGTLAQLRPGTASPKDQTTRYVYDGQNRVIGEIDPEGYVTEQVYDERGHVAQRTRYATPLTTGQITLFDAGTGGWRPAATTGFAGDRTEFWRYNALDQLDQQTNADGTVTSFAYDAAGRVVSTTKAAGTAEARTQNVRYDGVGRVIGELSARGATLLVDGQTQAQVDAIWAQYGTIYTYDAAGRKTSQIVSDGTRTQRTIFFYNEDDQLTHTINALGEVQENQYDGLGQLVKTIAYGGRLSATTFNGLTGGLANTAIRNAVQEVLAQRTAGNQAYANAQTVFDYDARGLLKSTTDVLGYTTSTSYNAFGQANAVTSQIRLDGTVVSQSLIYDRRGLLKERTDDTGAGGLNALTKTAYDAFGRLVKTTDARTVESSIVYDRIGRVVQTVDGGGTLRVTNYDAFNRITSTIDGNSQTTTYRYDVAARTVEVTTPENIRSRVTRNRHGEVESSTDGAGVTTTYGYTENGELKTTTTPLNGTGTKYDSLGRVAESTDANGTVTRYGYDALNRVTSRIVDPDGAKGLKLTTTYVYEDTATGTTVLTTEADGRQTLKSFDVAGRLVASTVDPSGLALTTGFELDADGRTLKVTDPYNIVTRYEYDKLGRRTAEVTDDAGNADDLKLTRTYVYDLAGRLASSTDWTGARTLYAYDDANRLVYQVDPMGAVRYTEYDGEGRERRVTRLATPLTAANLTALGTQPTVAQITALRVTVPAKDEVTGRVFDKDGRVQFSVDAMGTVTEFRYDGAGRVKQQIAYATPVTPAAWMDAGAAAPAGSADDRVTSTLYDDLGRATTVVDAEGGITVLAYDAAGNLRQKTAYARVADAAKMQALRTAGSGWNASTLGAPLTHAQDRITNYRYDTAGRLRYEYDAGGYVTETVYQGLKTTVIRHAAANIAVDAIPPDSADDHATSVEVDKAGRVWKSVDAMGVETRSVYDRGGRLTAQTQAYGLTEATTTGYVYDDAGHVVLKTVAQGTDAASATRYGYDAQGRMTTEIEARGVALAELDTAWARKERLAQGKAEFAAQLPLADRQAFLTRYTTTHEYDAAGRRTKTINALGAATSTQYDAFGNAVKVTDPLGNVGYFYFDKLNRVTMQIDPEGNATRTLYWGAGSNQVAKVRRYFVKVLGATTAQMPDPPTGGKDALTTNVYDRLDRLVSSTMAVDGGSVTESTQYNAGGNRFDKQVRNKVGGTAVFNTDKLGNTIKETLPVTVNGVAVVNSYGYDAFGNRTSAVEAVNPDNRSGWISRTTSYRYDKSGRLTHRIGTGYEAFDGASQTTSTVIPVEWTRYDALGRVVEQISRGNWVGDSQVVGGARSLTRYDAAGNKLEQIAADGAYTAYDYDAAGHAVRESARGTAAVVSGSTWTAPGVNAAIDRNTVMVYDVLGRLVEKSRENVRYWEANPNSNEILAPLSTPTNVRLQGLVYDAAGNVVQEIDGRGNSIYSYYDRISRKVLRIDQESYAVGWDYEGFQDAATTEVKYAGRVAAYAVQTDTQQAASLRDPAQLRAGLSLTDARTTRFVLDTLGRVTEKRVLGVASTYLNASGAAVNVTMDAVSTFEYDGLGNVKKQRDLVGLTPDGAGQVWNETVVQYDSLGRETRRIAPGFTDFQNNWVTPTTDTEYNGLGLVSRTTQRGLTMADDRVSMFDYNANGDRTATTDAEGHYTLIALDAFGRVGRTTSKEVLRADATKVDIVKRYAYDAMGRVTAEFDGDATHAQTGDIRRTRYNVFGDITGKGLGDGWQEFAEYNVLGKVERNNSDGGAIAVTLYDRNGNATRKIVSAVAGLDLRSMSIPDVAADLARLNHTFSVHDKRNQLLKTVEFAAQFQLTAADRQSALLQKLSPLYGAISMNPVQGADYTGAKGDSPALPKTPVSTPTGQNALGGPSAAGGTNYPLTNLGEVPPVIAQNGGTGAAGFAVSTGWTGGSNTMSAVQLNAFFRIAPLSLPDKFPMLAGNSSYEIRRQDAMVPSTSLAGTITPSGSVVLESRASPGAITQNGITPVDERFDLVGYIGGKPVVLGTLVLTTVKEISFRQQSQPTYQMRSYSYRMEYPSRLVIPKSSDARMEVLRKSGGAGDPSVVPLSTLPAYTFPGYTGPGGSPDTVQALSTQGWPQGTYPIEIRTYDANGALVKVMEQDVTVGAAGSVVAGTIRPVQLPAVEFRSMPSGHAGIYLNTPAHASGRIWIRFYGADANFNPSSYAGGVIDLTAIDGGQWNYANSGYEYVIETNGQLIAGSYQGGGGGGIPWDRSVPMYRAQTAPQTFTFSPALQAVAGSPTFAKYVVEFDMSFNGQSRRITRELPASGGLFSVSETELNGWVASSAFSRSAPVAYVYRVYAGEGSGRRLAAQGQGEMTAGRANVTATGLTSFPAIANLGVPNLVGNVKLTVGGQVYLLSDTDPRRWGSDELTLNLLDWLNRGSDTSIRIEYADPARGGFDGTVVLRTDGSVVVPTFNTSYFGSKSLEVTVPGSTKLKLLELRVRGGALDARTVTMVGGKMVIPVLSTDIGKTFDVDFTATNDSDQVTYVGKGTFTVGANGVAVYDVRTPTYKPSFLKIDAAVDDKVQVRLRPKGGAWREWITLPEGTAARNLLLDDYTPQSGPDLAWDYEYVITGKNTVITSKGHGDFSVAATRTVTMGTPVSDRTPLAPITFYGPSNQAATQLRLTVDGGTVVLPGTWNGTQMVYVWQQPLGGRVFESETSFAYRMEILTAGGQPAEDVVGELIKPVNGTLVVGTSLDKPFEFKQYVTQFVSSAQVRHYQTFNAFGEIAEEYDDGTLKRARDMAEMYRVGKLGSFTVNETAVRTTFTYNALGKLISKQDPETFETLANGFIRRIRPTTTYGFDLLGRTVSSTDANGYVSRQSYVGGSEQAATRFNADGSSRGFGYDVFLDNRKVTNELGNVVLQDYDKLGQLITVSRLNITRAQNFTNGEFTGAKAVGSTLVERYSYGLEGQRITHTNASGVVDKTFYDSLGRVVKTVSGSGAETRYEFVRVDAGDAVNPVLSVGDLNLGGYRRTTYNPDGRTLGDEIDYFGRTTWHKDLENRQYAYHYGLSGKLLSQDGTSGQSVRYDYTLSGLLYKVFDLNPDNRMFTEYGYDDAGNRTHESYGQIAKDSEQIVSVIQASVVQFDELNRIARTWDGDAKSYDLRYEYDAVGNRRSATSTYWTVTGASAAPMSLWYTYDKMNRFTTTMGSLTMRGTSATDTNGSIVRGDTGVSIVYDALGQRTSATTKVSGADRVETYTYSADGYLEDSYANGVLINRRRNDESGRTLQMKEWKDNGTFYQTTTSIYDADNRLQLEKILDDKGVTRDRSYLYYQAGSTDIGTANAGGAGVLAKTIFDTVTTTYEYQYWDAAKQTRITTTQQGLPRPGVTSFTYNSNGHLREKFDEVPNVRRRFMTTAQGVVILREEYRNGASEPLAHRFFYADGHQVGDVGNDGKAESQLTYVEQMAQRELTPEERRKRDRNPVPVNTADFDQNYQPVNSGYPGAVSSSYTVRAGDTLSSIAQSVWGDSAMWYMIAEVNGLNGSEALREGQVLVIPNKVTNIHNNATTFRPYNPGDAIGRVDPTLPEPPPPPAAGKKGCGAVGMILMVVVAVVVTIYTAGAMSGLATGFMQTMAAGASVMTGATVGTLGAAATIGIAAAGAAVGSIASQLVGMATGNVDKFSWKAVGQSAFAAGVTAGVGSAITSAVSPGGFMAESSIAPALRAGGATSAMVRAGVGSAVSQAIQGKWSWREVGASTVAAGAGYVAGEAVGSAMNGVDVTMTQVAKGVGASVAGSWASSQVMGYNTAETRARLSQAFISGLAQGIGQALSAGEGNVATSGSYRNGSDMDSDRYVAASAGNYQNGADVDSSDMDEYERNERELKARAIVRDVGSSAPVTGGTWENVEGYRSRVGGGVVGATGRAALLGDAQASMAMAQSPERAYTVAPSVEPGVYGFESGTNVFGRFQAGWYTSPLDQVGLLGENRFRLPTAVVTTDHGLAVEAWQQYADRIEAARPQSMVPASTFWGGYGQTMGAAWNGFAGGVANLASDLANRRFAEGGVKARSAFFQDVDRMGYWRAGLLRAVEGTLSPWMLGGSIVDSSTGTVGSLWRGDMAGAGRNLATLTLDSAAATAMVVGGRAGLSARTSFKPLGWIDVAEGFVPKARTYADFMKWIPNRAPDPGVPQLVDLIEGRFPGLVRQVEIPIHDVPPAGWNGPPPVITDLDIVLEGGRVIQVKEGSGGKIVKQLASSKEITGVDPIGFDVNKLLRGDEAPGFKPGTVREAARQGYTILNTVDDLLNHLDLIYGAR
ncbi:MAG TPA: LysM peptidoglycan-binding domain-containing protein [Vicinamibacterales bacterium]